MADAVNVQQIVAKLNEPPFSKDLSLVSPNGRFPAACPSPRPRARSKAPPSLLAQVTFDELRPVELLQLLNDVFAHLDEAHRVDVRDEPREVGGPRMLQFLRRVLMVDVPPDPEGQ